MASDRSDANVEVVFVCTGNRARSPLAEALLRRRLGDLPVRVSSCGTSEVGPVGVLPEMARAARELGVELSAHRASCVPRRGLSHADLVLGFEPFHVASAVVEGGASSERAFTLREFVELAPPSDGAGGEDVADRIARIVEEAHRRRSGSRLSAPAIADPLGQPPRVFDAVAAEIDALVRHVGDLLVGPPDRTVTFASS